MVRRTLIASGIGVGTVAAVALMFVLLARYAYVRPYSSTTLRQTWRADGTLDRLRGWTRERLADGGRFPSRVADWPKLSGGPQVTAVRVLQDAQGRPTSVEFEFGGAENHHGLIVGNELGHDVVFPVRADWGGGVWWYDEVPSMEGRK